MARTTRHTDHRYRWQIASRTVAAIWGGYVLANILGIFISYILPIPKSDAVMTGMLLSFAIYAGCVMWVFAVKTVSKAWIGLMLPAAILGGVALLLKFSAVV